jgi:putative transposase
MRPIIMAREKKPVHRVQMTEGKRNIIHQLLEEYDIQTAEDIQDALKDLLGGTIKEMMEAEMDNHLGYEKSQRSDSDDYRNGYKEKQVNSSYGSMKIEVPQDRKSTFEPQIVKKRQKDISDIDQKIISMYAKGMTTRQISDTIEDIYGFETSEGFISDVTDKILPQIEDWQNRPLDDVYPIIYIDAIHYSVRDNGIIRKLAAYVILGINKDGIKEVLSITVGENESSKYWLSVLNELKNRGVKDILIICADGLAGIKEAITAAFPKTEYQRCIVHQVRNTLKYVPDKDRKAFAADLKTIYHASDEEKARQALDRVCAKWTEKYPNSMKRWYDNWDAVTPIFKFSPDVRKVIYTTNAIESLNSTYRRLNRQRNVFPSDTALLKALYLATFEATKKWTSTIRNWGQVYGELSIMYEGRLPE